MYIPVNERLNCLIGGIKITPEEIAFPVQAIPQVLDLVLENQWIILGGDVLTSELKHTYDSWYYLPDANISLTANVKQSVEKCKRYISEYGKRNGEDFLYAFTISNSFVEGKWSGKQPFSNSTGDSSLS